MRSERERLEVRGSEIQLTLTPSILSKSTVQRSRGMREKMREPPPSVLNRSYSARSVHRPTNIHAMRRQRYEHRRAPFIADRYVDTARSLRVRDPTPRVSP